MRGGLFGPVAVAAAHERIFHALHEILQELRVRNYGKRYRKKSYSQADAWPELSQWKRAAPASPEDRRAKLNAQAARFRESARRMRSS